MANETPKNEIASKRYGRIVLFIMFVAVVTGCVWLVGGLCIVHPSTSQATTLDAAQKVFWSCLSGFLGMVGGKITS